MKNPGILREPEITCPLCRAEDILWCADYNGSSYLSCKNIYQCQACELSFADPLPRSEELAEIYLGGQFYEESGDPFEPQFMEFSRRLSLCRLALIHENTDCLANEKKIIDIGAGNAAFGKGLEKYDGNLTYDAVEPDNQVRKQYDDRVDNSYSDLLQVQHNYYDLAVVNQVLEHVPNPVNFLNAICRLVKTGGYVYIDVPYKDYIFKPSVGAHVLFWNHKSLSVACQYLGLQVICCHTAGLNFRLAKKFFGSANTLTDKMRNRWAYMSLMNRIMKKFGLPAVFDTFRRFHADQYGGDRQWLRLIAKKHHDAEVDG
jgi:SAM-dependent methyltransferase